ncbi:DinB family protein [Actinocorallia longicatena]|uniref:DinB family protein n=1 Tax=Actinocorallia longicatena TaxID=111803 RepID=A0ABP6Q1H3_9ACTN
MTIRPGAEPPVTLSDPRDLLLGYLDYYRGVIVRKLDGLGEDQARLSPLPSGWTPAELLCHLAAMERRWIRWGFLGEDLPDPWADRGPGDRWTAPGSVAEYTGLLGEGADLTRSVVEKNALDTVAATGGRFGGGEPAPTLGWILFHVLQEYARHAGQLDAVRELIDGATGE